MSLVKKKKEAKLVLEKKSSLFHILYNEFIPNYPRVLGLSFNENVLIVCLDVSIISTKNIGNYKPAKTTRCIN